MSIWGDEVDTDLLRPSPAVRRSGSEAGRWPDAEATPRSRRDTGPRRAVRAGGGGRSERGAAPPSGGVRSGTGAQRRPAGRRDLTRRTGIGVVVAVVAVGIVAGPLHAFRSPDTPAAPAAGRSQPQLPGPSGPATLRTPLAVSVDPAPAAATPCPRSAGIRCTPPAAVVTVDEVRAVRAVDRGRGAAVVLTLTSWDAATVATAVRSGQRLTVEVGRVPAPARLEQGGTLVLPVADRAGAVRTVSGLGLAAAPRARGGPGALGSPLELWTARISAAPCRTSAAPGARGVLVVDRGTECLLLRGPALTIRTAADLRLARPTDEITAWALTLGLAAADRPALARFTREQARTRNRIAFVVGGRVVTGLPTVTAEAAAGIDLGVADEAEGRLLLHRLRP